MPESRLAPHAGGDVRKEEPDDCPCGSKGETDYRAGDQEIDSEASSKAKICIARISGIFLEEMGKDNTFPEPNECAFEE